jgi:opacity protein-like surface antigen
MTLRRHASRDWFAVMLAVTATAIAAVATAQAAATYVPARRAGQWELRMSAGNAPEAVMQLCVDEATDKEMMDASLSIVTSLCPLPIWSRDGAAIVIVADCQIASGRTVVSRAELTGDFQESYVFRLHTKAGLGARSTVNLEHRYRWVGKTCAGGLRPGYVRLPNGGTMKLKQMMRLLENINETP